MQKKRISAAILMLSILVTGSYAANSYKKSIEADYNIYLSVNGEKPKLTDVNGKEVQPFTYEGTTYVPIRAVGENLGAEVSYDGTSRTASIEQDYQVSSEDIELICIYFDCYALGKQYRAVRETYDEFAQLTAADKADQDKVNSAIETVAKLNEQAESIQIRIEKLKQSGLNFDKSDYSLDNAEEDLAKCIASSEAAGQYIKSQNMNSEKFKEQMITFKRHSILLEEYADYGLNSYTYWLKYAVE